MNKSLMKHREVLETRAMQSVAGAMERASWDACRRTGAWMGLLLFSTFRARRAVGIRNVQLAFPDLSDSQARRIVRRSYQNFAMMFCEFLHLRVATPEQVRAYCDLQGFDIMTQAREQGRGAMMLTAHIGNWEVLAARVAQEVPVTAVARPTSNAGVESHIASIRAAVGIKVLLKNEAGRSAVRALKQGDTVIILPDQYAWPDGALLPMFGHPTRVVTSLARIALLTGAPIVPLFGVRRTPWLADGRIIGRTSPSFELQKTGDRESDILDGTRRVIDEIENVVRHYPEQWLWVHKRWRDRDLQPNSAASSTADEQANDQVDAEARHE